jgi:hypothetical protein
MFGITGAQLMGAGFSPGQASALVSSSATSAISAAGTTLGTATALTTSINLVSTAVAGAGVKLPTGYTTNDAVAVFNDNTGASFYVYPPTSTQQINQLAVGIGMLLATNTSCIFIKVSTTRWVANLSS